MGICEAYNKGAEQAQYQILCFVHEDVEFVTQDWGRIVCGYFEKIDNLGALGVSGGFKTRMVTGWGSGIPSWDHMHILHGESLIKTFSEESIEVNTLDGVIIFTRKKVWSEVLFDKFIPGFHLYDIDYTYRVSKQYKVLVIGCLLLKHYSSGNFGKDWINAVIRYHRKKNIFSDIPLNNHQKSQIRKFYYSFSQSGMYEMSLYYKLKYLFVLGVDKDSLKCAIGFLFIRYWHKFHRFIKNAKESISRNSYI